jgi:hypothetical protein
MTMDIAGMIRPKTAEGETANLATYLINHPPPPSDRTTQAHRGTLESLAILGDKIARRKEKNTHHGSGSKDHSKDACNDITQSRIDKAHRRCVARDGYDSEDSEETQEYDGEPRGAIA